jgi:hypothetical protein
MEKDNLEMLLEDISGKFDLVLEGHSVLNKRIDDLDHKLDDRFDLLCFKMQTGHESLNGKIDGVEASLSQRIDNLETSLSSKIDAVAADLAAHRRDTEAHPAIYKVKEGN